MDPRSRNPDFTDPDSTLTLLGAVEKLCCPIGSNRFFFLTFGGNMPLFFDLLCFLMYMIQE